MRLLAVPAEPSAFHSSERSIPELLNMFLGAEIPVGLLFFLDAEALSVPCSGGIRSSFFIGGSRTLLQVLVPGFLARGPIVFRWEALELVVDDEAKDGQEREEGGGSSRSQKKASNAAWNMNRRQRIYQSIGRALGRG